MHKPNVLLACALTSACVVLLQVLPLLMHTAFHYTTAAATAITAAPLCSAAFMSGTMGA